VNSEINDRSGARLNDFLKTFAVDAELAASLASVLKQSDTLIADYAADAPLGRIKPLMTILIRRLNSSTLKSHLIMAYIPLREPLAKTRPQLRQDTLRLLALPGRLRQRRLCARARWQENPPGP
jgi:hypothetical protein